ncbi:PIG-L family deacetylase [Thermogutta sp.]|uniref:PIG-L family deacetylase n=1 Tax=Thermogutta sp. TaxID=1962930 RepID=UPI0025F3B157|nr:PIG-L family deacetylase [Thermogutta sp.]
MMETAKIIHDTRQSAQETVDVIAVGAHPDDVEIGCGGFLHSLSQRGYRVGIIDLTDGEPTPHCPSPEQRLAEAARAAQELQVKVRVVLSLPNRRLFDSFEARVALAHQFRLLKPRWVLGLGVSTPMASPDHEQAGQITEAAVFYSRLSKWEEYFEGLPPHTIDFYLHYFLALRYAVLPGRHPVVVNISDSLEPKLRAIAAYESQFAHRPEVLDRIRVYCQQLGQSVGFSAGEVISHPTGWGFNDLFAGLLGSS